MDPILQNLVLLPAWPTALLLAVAIVSAAAWIALHWFAPSRYMAVRIVLAIARLALGFFALRLLLAALAKSPSYLLQTPWDLSLVTLLAVASVEAVIALYARERRTLSRGQGRLIVLLRAAAVLALALVLIEPTFSRAVHHRDERFVALLLDDSTSIDLADPQATLAERIGWVETVTKRKLPAPPRQGEASGDAANAERAYVEALPEADRKLLEQSREWTRRKIGAAALSPTKAGEKALLDELQKRYTVKTFRFASSPSETPFAKWQAEPSAKSPAAERETTDLAAALARVQSELPAERLAGVIVASDGRHNSKQSLETIGSRFEARSIPVSSVMLGSSAAVADAVVRVVDAPDRTQLGDSVTVRVDFNAAGLQGQKAEVQLRRGEQVIEKQELVIPTGDYDGTVELHDTPDAIGLRQYEVAIRPLEGERSADNNTRSFAVQVTDDSIKVLLIDERPRWEYRTLRNIFNERAKGVRLQHVLLRPEEIEGAEPKPVIPASATRPAGETEATALPATPEEWELFDVIILGDVSPDRFNAEQTAALVKCVEERGASLVVIAGANNMPAKFADTPLAKLLPIAIGPPPSDASPSSDGFRLALAPEGQDHQIMQLDANRDSNREAWSKVPEMHYRTLGAEVPSGAAQVLAYALPLNDATPWESTAEIDGDAPRATSSDTQQKEELARRRDEYIRRNALVVTQLAGAGRVCLLQFDSTWRLQYKRGDTLQHRFWGQVLRWATANKLPYGSERVRMGTDHIVYAPNQSPQVRVSLRDAEGRPMSSDELSVVVQQGDKKIATSKLTAVAKEPGIYTAQLEPLATAGTYQVSLTADGSASELIDAVKDVRSEIVSARPASPEVQEYSANPEPLLKLAEAGGVVVAPHEASEILKRLGQPSGEIVERTEYPLWRSWPVLLVIVSLVTSEWLLRKRAGLT